MNLASKSWHGSLARGFPNPWARRPCHVQCSLAFTFLALLNIPAFAQPTLDRSTPSAISAKGGEIIIHATGLKEPLSLWSIPAAQATFSNISSSVTTCRLTFQDPINHQFLTLRL